MIKKTQFFLILLSFFYLIALIVFSSAPVWPETVWWVANFLQALPLWIWGLPIVMFSLVAQFFKLRKLLVLNLISALILIFGVMNFSVPLDRFLNFSKKSTLRIMTVNVGGHPDLTLLTSSIMRYQPDLIYFQELATSGIETLDEILPSRDWYSKVDHNIGLASRWPIKYSKVRNREFLGGWGNYVGHYLVASPFGDLQAVDVHLETPRKGIEPIIYQHLSGIPDMINVTENQRRESEDASMLTASLKPVLVAGDFNMMKTNPIFHRYWSRYKDVYSKGGFGFGWTKFTDWHGIRIDHILCDHHWKVLRAWVGPEIADHRMLLADLKIDKNPTRVSEDKLDPRVVKENDHGPWATNTDTYVGSLSSNGTVVMAADKRVVHNGRASLKVQSKFNIAEASFGMAADNWHLTSNPLMKFSYKVPTGTPIGLIVKTSYDDWLCIGGTATFRCPYTQTKDYFTLMDDDAWHDARINVASAVWSSLEAVKILKELQFLFNNQTGDLLIWLDDLKIMLPSETHGEIVSEDNNK